MRPATFTQTYIHRNTTRRTTSFSTLSLKKRASVTEKVTLSKVIDNTKQPETRGVFSKQVRLDRAG
ncbi:hypothetical protein [Aliivibrio kagoshimensis]|uniref:hypothetical protein n=1 Tax=Aliivibrio kagoshimensis TaxID=2910230 RepID=UPI003D0E914B